MLRFLGRGSAFSDEQNSAFFTCGNELVLIDCPMSSFCRIRKLGTDTLAGVTGAEVTVVVTHTHGDHVGGIPMLIQYVYYRLKRPVTVIAPSDEVAKDLVWLIDRLEGCAPASYTVVTADKSGRDWLKRAIPTVHTPELSGRCFGYQLSVDGRNVVYTGDTLVIEPFLPYLTEGTYLYSDASAHRTEFQVHITAEELLEKVRGYDIRLFLMHLDDAAAAEGLIKGTDVQLAPLY